jgi:GntR family transcriptional repressor for pyruvate dehydrogenase complex
MKKIGRAAPLGDQVYGALHADIEEGRLQPGERLPIEPQLALAFGVSRTVIREAISRLRNDGLVTAKQGSGVFVAEGPFNQAFRLPARKAEDRASIREIYELRLGVEVEAAALAARRRVPEDCTRIAKALAAIEATKLGPDLGVAADAQFHRAIALATGNSKIAAFQQYLSVFLLESIAAARANTLQTQPATVNEVTGEHAAIFRAIEAGDAEAARGAMRTHLNNAQERLGLQEAVVDQQMRRLR